MKGGVVRKVETSGFGGKLRWRRDIWMRVMKYSVRVVRDVVGATDRG